MPGGREQQLLSTSITPVWTDALQFLSYNHCLNRRVEIIGKGKSHMNKGSRLLRRRDFLRVAGVAAASAALSACGLSPSSTASGDKGAVQLVYQDWRTEWFPSLAQQMLEIFNKDHPNIRVFYTPDPDNLEEKMLDDMAAGTAPDVLSGCCEFFPAWANAGYLMDLRPLVEADLDKETIDDWSPAQYQALFTRDGKQFGLPKYHGALALYYNKDLFDAAAVEYPAGDWTYDDYWSAMTRLTRHNSDGITQWGSMFDVTWDRIQIHVNSFGGHYVNPDDPARCEMSAPPAQEAMEWLRRRMWEDKVMATFLDVQNIETRQAFIQQKVAMVEDGSWALKDILDNARFRIGVAPFPTGPKRHATLATTDGFGIYAGTKHPEAAWELLKFLISKDYGRAMARAHFLQPARASLVPEWVEYIRQEYPERSKDVDIAAFADGQIKGYSVTAETFPNMVGVSKLAKDAWDQIFTLGKMPVSEMEKVCQQIEKIQQGVSLSPSLCACNEQS
jgi:multiple sugar transport system substrate-binding protein